ncbi:MAG: hypothetical protein MUF30_08525 [Burkholderiales bacterium]|nr:hypothetical protein [Burkholderiales bacterium]
MLTDALLPAARLTLVLAAYAAYVVNAAQFLLKLRAARRADPGSSMAPEVLA